MTPHLDQRYIAKLYWAAVFLHFALFSFNALATCCLAALVGVKWEVLTVQEKFLIFVAVIANWTGLIIVYVQRSVSRLTAGKAPLETGDTEHHKKA